MSFTRAKGRGFVGGKGMHDAIVVGARCAGASTAMLLARLGYRVLMLDKAARDEEMKHSTHFLQAPGAARLRRWGLLPRLEAACPGFDRYEFDFGFVRIEGTPPAVDGDARAFGPRRFVIDPLLVDAAIAAGVDYLPDTRLVDLLRDGQRVVGALVQDAHGHRRSLQARMVIGADGPASTVAKLVDAPHYHEAPAQQVTVWGYWADLTSDRLRFHTRPGVGLYWGPTASKQTLVGVNWAMPMYKSLAVSAEVDYYARIRELAPALAEQVARATLTEPLRTGSTRNFLRVPHGPGWVLVGDAGHKKDPCTAQGISDAFIDADQCTQALDAGLRGEQDMTAGLEKWHAQRDARLVPRHHMTVQMAGFAAQDTQERALFQAIASQPTATTAFLGLLSGATCPQQFFAPDNLAAIARGA